MLPIIIATLNDSSILGRVCTIVRTAVPRFKGHRRNLCMGLVILLNHSITRLHCTAVSPFVRQNNLTGVTVVLDPTLSLTFQVTQLNVTFQSGHIHRRPQYTHIRKRLQQQTQAAESIQAKAKGFFFGSPRN